MQIDFLDMAKRMAACWNVNVTVVSLKSKTLPAFDHGMRQMLLQDEQPSLRALLDFVPSESDCTKAYVLLDCFGLGYFFLWLPLTCRDAGDVMIVGPYLHRAKSQAEIHILCNTLGISVELQENVSIIYENIPIITAMDPWHMFLGNLYAFLYPKEPVSFYAMNTYRVNQLVGKLVQRPKGSTLEYCGLKKFLSEQDIIDAISKGDTETALKLIRRSHEYDDDGNKDMRNQLERAAEYWVWGASVGGVHNKVIQAKTRYFRQKFESAQTKQAQNELYEQMLIGYCDIVCKYSRYSSSALIRSVIAEIGYDLSSDISLQSIAEHQNVNTSYLSSRFKQELGLSLMEYVLAERMDFAIRRFDAGATSIQEVAQQCGIYDMGYFRRCFKKETGVSPSEYIKKMK